MMNIIIPMNTARCDYVYFMFSTQVLSPLSDTTIPLDGVEQKVRQRVADFL